MAESAADTTESALGVINRYLSGLFEGRAADVVGLYGADAEVIRYDGVARDGGIDSFVDELTQSRLGGNLISIDRLAAGQDTIAWDATIETSEGPIQTSDVFVLSPDGSILRHVQSPAVTGVPERSHRERRATRPLLFKPDPAELRTGIRNVSHSQSHHSRSTPGRWSTEGALGAGHRSAMLAWMAVEFGDRFDDTTYADDVKVRVFAPIVRERRRQRAVDARADMASHPLDR